MIEKQLHDLDATDLHREVRRHPSIAVADFESRPSCNEFRDFVCGGVRHPRGIQQFRRAFATHDPLLQVVGPRPKRWPRSSAYRLAAKSDTKCHPSIRTDLDRSCSEENGETNRDLYRTTRPATGRAPAAPRASLPGRRQSARRHPGERRAPHMRRHNRTVPSAGEVSGLREQLVSVAHPRQAERFHQFESFPDPVRRCPRKAAEHCQHCVHEELGNQKS